MRIEELNDVLQKGVIFSTLQENCFCLNKIFSNKKTNLCVNHLSIDFDSFLFIYIWKIYREQSSVYF